MAINIINEPTGIYPCYNDSYIVFTSNLSNQDRAEITIPNSTEFPTFTLYPIDGRYIFNIREIAKYRLNEQSFADTLVTDGRWCYSVDGYLSQGITIKVYNGTTNDTLTKYYQFYRGTKQIGETNFDNPNQLLLPSKNGIDYNLTYWEGFPFDFIIQRVGYSPTKRINVRNKNTGVTSIDFKPTESNPFRVFIDKGGSEDWTNANLLPLTDNVNRLEVLDNGIFKTNLTLKKRTDCSGVYLKWFNNDGGYSYYLFDPYHETNVSGNTMGKVLKSEFQNIGSTSFTGLQKSIGKEGEKDIIAKTRVDHIEARHLESLFTSPSVQLYTSQTAYVGGNWIDVEVSGSMKINNKKEVNEVKVNIELPELITPTL